MARLVISGQIASMRARWLGRLTSRPGRKALATILAIAGSFLLMTTLLHLPHGPEHWSADLRTKYLSLRLATQHPRLALIYVSEATLASHPYVSPTDRGLLADLVRAVDAVGPAAIGFDFIIDRPTEPAKDEALFAALRAARATVIAGATGHATSHTPTSSSFQANYFEKIGRKIGHLHFSDLHSSVMISDHVVREMAKERHHPTRMNSFARQLADAVGSTYQPRSTYISWLLEPRDGTETFLTLSAEQVLGRSNVVLPIRDLLKDRIVLIGGNFPDRDQHLCPLSVLSDERFPGLFIHAQIIAQLLDKRSLSTLSLPAQLAALILSTLLGYYVGRRQRHIHLLAELFSVCALTLVAVLTFHYANLILPYTGILLTWLCGLTVGHYTRPGHA